MSFGATVSSCHLQVRPKAGRAHAGSGQCLKSNVRSDRWNNSVFAVISLVGQWQPSLSVAACVNKHSVVCYLLKKCQPRLFNWQSLYPDLPYNSLNPSIIPFQKFSLTSLFASPIIPHSAVGNWQCTWCHRVVTCMHQLNFFYCIWWKVGSL